MSVISIDLLHNFYFTDLSPVVSKEAQSFDFKQFELIELPQCGTIYIGSISTDCTV